VPDAAQIETLRSFNRTVTAAIGALDESHLGTGLSLPEARAVRELAQQESTEVSALREALRLDSGYLSRMLAGLEGRGLVRREPSPTDGRRQLASLTPEGRDASSVLDTRADEAARELLDGLSPPERARLVAAMRAVRDVLSGPPASRATVLRAAGSGDWGWIVSRHGALYAEQFGWDESFEALVARIVAGHVESRDPRTEAAWIAEVGGEPAGCVLCLREDEKTAKLRLLLVEPHARGLGIGARLVEECIRFSRRAGYERLVLWTNHPLTAARRIYDAAGFVLTGEEEHESFGTRLTGQTMSLEL
jgi:DNA-binding MarR family transcriptional regulator/N-acetylglutamate synthase-like GNAT family acetyltransferase